MGDTSDAEPVAAQDGDLVRLSDHVLDAAEGLGIEVSSAHDLLCSPFAETSGDGDERRLCTGGGNEDEPLCVVKLGGESINVRYWSDRGAPDFEIDFDLPSGRATYAKAHGERII